MPGIGEEYLLNALNRRTAVLGSQSDSFLSIARQESQQKNAAFGQFADGVVGLVGIIVNEDKKQKAAADEIALTDIKLQMERDQQNILNGMQQSGYDPADPFTVETARKYRDQTFATYEANNPNLSEEAKARLKIWWTSQDTNFVGVTQEINGAKQLNYENNQSMKAAMEAAAKGDFPAAMDYIGNSRLTPAQQKEAGNQVATQYGASALMRLYVELQMTPDEVKTWQNTGYLPVDKLQAFTGGDQQKMLEYQIRADSTARGIEQAKEGSLAKTGEAYLNMYAEHIKTTGAEFDLQSKKAQNDIFSRFGMKFLPNDIRQYEELWRGNDAFNAENQRGNDSVLEKMQRIANQNLEDTLKPKDPKLQDQAYQDFLGWYYSQSGITNGKATIELQKRLNAMGGENFGKALDVVNKRSPDETFDGIAARIMAGTKSSAGKSSLYGVDEGGRMLDQIRQARDKAKGEKMDQTAMDKMLSGMADDFIILKTARAGEKILQQSNTGEVLANARQAANWTQTPMIMESPALVDTVKYVHSGTGFADQKNNAQSAQQAKVNLDTALAKPIADLARLSSSARLPSTINGQGNTWKTKYVEGRYVMFAEVPAGTPHSGKSKQDGKTYVVMTPEVVNGKVVFMVQDPTKEGPAGFIPVSKTKW